MYGQIGGVTDVVNFIAELSCIAKNSVVIKIVAFLAVASLFLCSAHLIMCILFADLGAARMSNARSGICVPPTKVCEPC